MTNDELLTTYAPLLHKTVGEFWAQNADYLRTTTDIEDLQQIARVGLIEVSARKPTIQWCSLFARRAMTNAMRAYIARTTTGAADGWQRGYPPVQFDAEWWETNEVAVDQLETWICVWDILHTLTPLQRQVVMAIVVGYPVRWLAEDIRVSKFALHRQLKAAAVELNRSGWSEYKRSKRRRSI